MFQSNIIHLTSKTHSSALPRAFQFDSDESDLVSPALLKHYSDVFTHSQVDRTPHTQTGGEGGREGRRMRGWGRGGGERERERYTHGPTACSATLNCDPDQPFSGCMNLKRAAANARAYTQRLPGVLCTVIGLVSMIRLVFHSLKGH